MNIDKYIENITQTTEGFCFKDNAAFENDFDKVCYIPEGSMERLIEMQGEGEDKTDLELIENGGAYTRNSLRQLLLEYMQDFYPHYRLEDVVENKIDVCLFQICDWRYPETILDEGCFEEDFEPSDDTED